MFVSYVRGTRAIGWARLQVYPHTRSGGCRDIVLCPVCKQPLPLFVSERGHCCDAASRRPLITREKLASLIPNNLTMIAMIDWQKDSLKKYS
jgi:uncharacterized protein YbaR (Trm112 family)